MKIKLIVACLFISTIIAAQELPPPGGKPKDFKIPPKQETVLSNGLRATRVQFGSVPKVTVQIIVKTGNIHEQADEVWLADLTAEMIREGTQTLDAKALADKVAAMGGEINSFAGMDQFVIVGTVLSEFAPELIKLMADLVMNPALPESETERIKNDLKRALAVQQTIPQNIATAKFFSTLYQDHPYGRYYPTPQMLDVYTTEQVKEFHRQNFGAKRTVVYVAGKFDDALTLNAITNAFSTWIPGPEVSYLPANPVSKKDVTLLNRANAPQSTLMIGLPVVPPSHPDYQALALTNTLLGGAFGSRITKNIREDKGYTYSPFSTIQHRHGTSVWYEQADVTSEHTSASLREIAREINRLQTEAPTEEELNEIKSYSAGSFVRQNSNPFGIIGQLNFMDQHNLPESYLENYINNLHAITPEKVKQTAATYLKYQDMTLVLVGDKKLIEKQIQAERQALKLK